MVEFIGACKYGILGHIHKDLCIRKHCSGF